MLSDEKIARESRFITEPSVFVVGSLMVRDDGLQAFLDENGSPDWTSDGEYDGEVLAEVAGRICYDSFSRPRPGGNKAYHSHILESGHGRIFEHTVFSFILTGVSRNLTHQFYTHTVGFSRSMRSQRFIDEKDCRFVVPPEYQGGSIARVVFEDSCLSALDRYEALCRSAVADDRLDSTTKRKRIREAARAILPSCVETKVFVTANTRALRAFLETRGQVGCDREIRNLVIRMLAAFKPLAPAIFADMEVSYNSVDGLPFIDHKYSKV